VIHPYLTSQLASERSAELRARGDRARRQAIASQGRARRHVIASGPRNSVRYRAGWTLVEIGLRLAGTSGGA
jgi:hypothetical protein